MSKMISRLIAKPDTQKMIKALRASGLTVNRDKSGAYTCEMLQHQTKNGKRTGETRTIKLFAALPGSRGYLVRMRSDLFEAA